MFATVGLVRGREEAAHEGRSPRAGRGRRGGGALQQRSASIAILSVRRVKRRP